MADAAALAARFDVDIRDGAFWSASLGVLRTTSTITRGSRRSPYPWSPRSKVAATSPPSSAVR